MLYAVDSTYIPRERDVKLVANASLHVYHAQQSLAAMQTKRPVHLLKPNLVIVTGQPLWYALNSTPCCGLQQHLTLSVLGVLPAALRLAQ